MGLITSKKGIYNWFVLVVAVMLLITAFISLYVQKNSMEFETLGERSSEIYDKIAKQDLMQIEFEEAADRASSKAILDIALYSGLLRPDSNLVSDVGFYKKGTEYNKKRMKEKFEKLFITNLNKELENYTNYKLAEYTVRFEDGNHVFGEGELVEDEYTSRFGDLNLSYIPSFSFKFENYNLDEYDRIYKAMNSLYESMEECERDIYYININYNVFVCSLDKISTKRTEDNNFKIITQGLEYRFDKDCLGQFDDNYFKEYKMWGRIKNSEDYDKIKYVCIKDTNRFIAGHAYKDGKNKFIVKNPIYVFKINYEKIKRESSNEGEDGTEEDNDENMISNEQSNLNVNKTDEKKQNMRLNIGNIIM